MTDDHKISWKGKLYKWITAVIIAFLAAFAMRLFFAILGYIASNSTGFFDGGFGYLITHYEVGKYLHYGISEAFACYVFIGVFNEKYADKSTYLDIIEIKRKSFIICCAIYSFLLLYYILDFSYFDAFGAAAGLLGFGLYRFSL